MEQDEDDRDAPYPVQGNNVFARWPLPENLHLHVGFQRIFLLHYPAIRTATATRASTSESFRGFTALVLQNYKYVWCVAAGQYAMTAQVSRGEGSPRQPSRWIYWALALLIAALLLYFSLRKVDWAEVGRTLAHADLRYVAIALAISSFALLMRALRWRILLRARADVTVGTAFWATCAGYFGNNFLPARAGEFIRTVVVSANTGLSKTFVLTTALAERLADAVTLVVISSIVLLSFAIAAGLVRARGEAVCHRWPMRSRMHCHTAPA